MLLQRLFYRPRGTETFFLQNVHLMHGLLFLLQLANESQNDIESVDYIIIKTGTTRSLPMQLPEVDIAY